MSAIMVRAIVVDLWADRLHSAAAAAYIGAVFDGRRQQVD